VSGDLIINTGVTEERAAEIARGIARSEMERFSSEANELGTQRISDFSDRLIEEFSAKAQLGAFADPAFQVLLRKAQAGAASTDRETDYDLLVALLDDRVKRGSDRHIRAGLDQAVQMVDHVDGEALLGLTVLQAAQQFGPLHGQIDRGLDLMDNLFEQLMQDSLPEDMPWLDHLDVLGAVRVMHLGLGTLKPFDEYYPDAHFIGYLSPGIEVGSDQESRVAEELAAASVRMESIDHELRPGFRRLPFVTVRHFDRVVEKFPFQSTIGAEVARRIAVEEYGLGTAMPELREPLIQKLEERPNLQRLRAWWNSIPTGVQITAVGRVLATANAKRLDKRGLLPPLD